MEGDFEKRMKCIYDKSIPCELNPDGLRTKDFICLKCHKPKKESKNKIIRKQKNSNKNKTFNVRRKNKESLSKGWRRRRGSWIRRK